MTTAKALLIEKTEVTKSPKRYTLEEYFILEERSKHKHEFRNGEITQMAGGSINHSKLTVNIAMFVGNALLPMSDKYQLFDSNLKVYIASENKVLYPDAFIISGEEERYQGRDNVIVNPLVIIEIASKSTRNYDRAGKFMSYTSLPSFHEYILIEQNKPHIESWFKTSEDNWHKQTVTDLTQSIHFRAVDLHFKLEDIYRNIKF